MSLQYLAGFTLMAIGCVFPFIYRGQPDAFMTRFLASFAFLSVGLGLIEWRVLAILAAFAACFFVLGYGFHIREKAYARNFPVFKAPPVGSVTRKDGFKHDLHIAKINAGFIIGIRYEEEVDLTPRTSETRWKDIFLDYASARAALLKRLPEFIPADQMPTPSTGDASLLSNRETDAAKRL